eukprot:CAMPEP_0115041080 /NCGR_PEP_ID=MMETSP0216-20121206/45295_1 /TAXON_ID=223996 /ORGANISM="Protocruzia adherens, Strain Boccale" /LENGTH=211 /DNA_ID=CAMNT_0002422611 /DNA_START=154 /DNA_END=789 /DNA_ORIENTATION=+
MTSKQNKAKSLPEDINFKILFLGNSGVGKTSLIHRFLYNSFEDEIPATDGLNFEIQDATIDDRKIRLEFWDASGDSESTAITSLYFRGVDAVIIMYDCSDRQSFQELPRWLNEARKYCAHNIPISVVANKIDLENRVVLKIEAGDLAEDHNASYFEVSAKDGTNARCCVEKMASEYLRKAMSASTFKISGERHSSIMVKRNKQTSYSCNRG